MSVLNVNINYLYFSELIVKAVLKIVEPIFFRGLTNVIHIIIHCIFNLLKLKTGPPESRNIIKMVSY